jgi:threonine/homoserine/homoserine lactone efflux protein
MIPASQLALFAVSALVLAISPGPNMMYLVSRSISQGRVAGLLSLAGVVCGFVFHILLVSFGLATVLLAIPLAYDALKWLGVGYLLYLAWQALKPGGQSLFETRTVSNDSPTMLVRMGFLTNALNPKVSVFYLSLFPQFIKPEYGSTIVQSLELGVVQLSVSVCVNLTIVFAAARVAAFFTSSPTFARLQRYAMGGILVGLAAKLALDESK